YQLFGRVHRVFGNVETALRKVEKLAGRADEIPLWSRSRLTWCNSLLPFFDEWTATEVTSDLVLLGIIQNPEDDHIYYSQKAVAGAWWYTGKRMLASQVPIVADRVRLDSLSAWVHPERPFTRLATERALAIWGHYWRARVGGAKVLRRYPCRRKLKS